MDFPFAWQALISAESFLHFVKDVPGNVPLPPLLQVCATRLVSVSESRRTTRKTWPTRNAERV